MAHLLGYRCDNEDHFTSEYGGVCWYCVRENIEAIKNQPEIVNSLVPESEFEPIHNFRFLFENGADPNVPDAHYDKVLYLITRLCGSSHADKIDKIRALLELCPDIDINVIEKGQTEELYGNGCMALEHCIRNVYSACPLTNAIMSIKESVTLLIHSGKVSLEHYTRALKVLEEEGDHYFNSQEKMEIRALLEEWHFFHQPIKEPMESI